MKDLYETKIMPELMEELGLKNKMSLPKLSKIVVNIGVKGATQDKKNIEIASEVLGLITGQKPRLTTARMSIAGFKLREGDKIGLKVTLRGKRMYDFFEKLVTIVLPRIKDFRGIKPGAFDKAGNYTLGLSEYSVFPEVDLGKVDRIYGIEMTIVTDTQNKEAAYLMLKKFGMPFAK